MAYFYKMAFRRERVIKTLSWRLIFILIYKNVCGMYLYFNKTI
jgi:hypothetical protein